MSTFYRRCVLVYFLNKNAHLTKLTPGLIKTGKLEKLFTSTDYSPVSDLNSHTLVEVAAAE